MADSAHGLPNPYTTDAPPPTPCNQTNLISTAEFADALSGLLHRLPPSLSLSLPTRRSSPPTTATVAAVPVINLSHPAETLRSNILSASSQHGFFQLTHHSIPSQLALSAESESLSLFNLSRREKKLYFPKNWPLGYSAHDDDDNDEGSPGAGDDDESFCLDSACSAESAELSLSSLREFAAEMEKLGLEVVEALSGSFGFVNPARHDSSKVCSLMWISQQSSTSHNPDAPGRMYPYVVGLQYQMRCHKYSMLTDSGFACVSPEVGSVLVTLGDISQVWSNGKFKKVRGRPIAVGNSATGANNSEHCISMTMLITLPIHSIVSPLLPNLDGEDGYEDELNRENDESSSNNNNNTREERVFNSFSFEDYAWRIYHERLHSKDPLVRFRV